MSKAAAWAARGYARIGPNEDLVQGVEKLCLAEGFRNAFVRGALGSLVDACLYTRDGGYRHVSGRRSRSSVSPARCGRSRTAR